jgi:hypothetical protein
MTFQEQQTVGHRDSGVTDLPRLPHCLHLYHWFQTEQRSIEILASERQLDLRLAAHFDATCRHQVSGAPHFHLPLIVTLAFVDAHPDEVLLKRVVTEVRECIAVVG